MQKKLEGKVAVITGGNSGIGLEVAKLFKGEGANLALFGRDLEAMNSAIAELGGDDLGYVGDVTSSEDIARFFAAVKYKYGRIDVLFVNAGISKSAPIAEVTSTFYDEMFAINVKGAFYTVQHALPLMASGSTITITTSNVAHLGYPNLSVYSATKAAVSSFTKSFAAELLDRGIRVNSVSPGPIETTLFTKTLDSKTRSNIFQHVAAGIPMKRMGQPGEIAKAVLFLASDDSSFMTGEEIVVDGGGVNLRV